MSGAWHQIQYEAYTEPVPLSPSEQTNPVWFPQWEQPPQLVRAIEYRHLLESFFFVEQSIITPPVVAPPLSWFEPASEPVLPPDRRSELGDISFVNVPGLQVNPTFFEAWVQPASEPVIDPEYRYTLPSFFSLGEPVAPPAPAPDYGWFRPASEPVLPVEYRHLLESYFDPANWEEIISTDSGVFFPVWMQPIDQPVLPIEYRYLLPDMFRSLEPVALAAMVASVLSGTGSVGLLSGQGSVNSAVSIVASGILTDVTSGLFFDTIEDSGATFQSDGVSSSSDTLFVEGVEVIVSWTVFSETILLTAAGGFSGINIGDSYTIQRDLQVVSGTGSDAPISGTGGV